jgi:hypothetical protein
MLRTVLGPLPSLVGTPTSEYIHCSCKGELFGT